MARRPLHDEYPVVIAEVRTLRPDLEIGNSPTELEVVELFDRVLEDGGETRRVDDFLVDANWLDAGRHELARAVIASARAVAYQRHVDTMAVPPLLASWVKQMSALHGPKVQVYQNVCGWLVALLIGRYGEAPAFWPKAFTDADVLRARAWHLGQRVQGHRGTKPDGTTYLNVNVADLGFARIKALIVLSGALVAFHALTILRVLCLSAAVCFGVVNKWTLPLIVGTALSNFLENELVDHLWRARSFTAPTNHHFALFTAAPGEAGGGTEVSGGSYARVDMAAGFTNFEGTGGETTNVDSAGTSGATQNRVAITFPTPSANWGLVTHMADFDAASAGNLYSYGALTASKNINNGDPSPNFPVGAYDWAIA
jgi:hypothetical protein